MKLLGKDITPSKVMAFVGEQLAARGLGASEAAAPVVGGVEPRVDPLSFNLRALEDNADATQGLPLETHRDGLSGRAVTMAKRVFRGVGQVFINEALGRQRVFNGHVRDSYAQLAAEVMRLRQRVAELEAEKAAPPVPAPILGGTVVENRPSFVRRAPGEMSAGSGCDPGWRPKRGSVPVRRRALSRAISVRTGGLDSLRSLRNRESFTPCSDAVSLPTRF